MLLACVGGSKNIEVDAANLMYKELLKAPGNLNQTQTIQNNLKVVSATLTIRARNERIPCARGGCVGVCNVGSPAAAEQLAEWFTHHSADKWLQ